MNSIGKIFAWGCGGILVIGIGLPIIFGSCSKSLSQDKTLSGSKLENFSNSVRSKVPMSKLITIKFKKVNETDEVNTTVEFEHPVPRFQPEAAAQQVTQAVIDTLMADGYNPKTLNTYIYTWVQARTVGATGSTMYIAYGSAIYHPINDQIVFTPIYLKPS